jgi:hypothetical protein
MLFAPLNRSSPFIGGLRCQAIQTEHGPYIAERTQKAVYILRFLCSARVAGVNGHGKFFFDDIVAYYRNVSEALRYVKLIIITYQKRYDTLSL